MALTLFSNGGDAATALPPHDLPEKEFPRGLTSTTESAGVPMTEGEALAAPLPPQVPSITVGASAPEARPEIPDPELTRAGIPRATENPLAKLFGGIRWDFLKPTTWMELIQENRRKMEVRRELSTPEMKETFRIALDKGMPLMAGDMDRYEDVEKENTFRIVDKFLKAMTGGSMHYGVNGVQRKLLIQEAAHRFFDGRGAESEVALKGEIVAAALAEKEISAVEYKERFSRISPLLTEYIGTGTRAQVLAGRDPGIIEKVKGELNEKYELQTEVADALNEAGGDPVRAIRMLRKKSAEAWSKSRSPYNPYNSFSGSANLAYSLSADRHGRTIARLEEMQAEFDRAGIPEAERADHIRDTVVATAWTQDSKDNIRLGSDRTIYINPGQVFGQRDAIVAEINASPASADQKHEAIQRLDLMRANMAAKMDELLRRTDATGGDEWKKDFTMLVPPARLVYGSPFSDSYIKFANNGKFASRMDAVDAYVKSQGDRGFLFKFDDAITVGIQSGTVGVGKTVVGAAAGLSGLGGMMGWDTAKEWSGRLGKTQMEMGDHIADLDKASDLRGNTSVVLKVAKDFSNTLTQIAPMLAGGQYAAGLNGLAGTVIRGMAVYGTPALQGAESVYGSALEQARRRKGDDLNSDEIIAVLGDSRVQAGAFLNAFQGAALARLLPRGTERAAVGGGLKGLTVRDFLSRGGGELLREPNFRKEMWQLTKNLFADASDEMIEEFLNTATDHIIRAGTQEEDLRFGDVLEDAAYSGFLGGGTGGLLPQLRHGERFYEKVPGAITITGSPPDTPGNPFRNPDGTLPTTPYHRSAGDPDLAEKEAKFNSILAGPISQADAAYNAVPETHGGKVLGTDLAREVLPEYQTTDGRTRYSGITTTTASQYGKDRLWREIHQRGGRESLLFTAGGPGSGKSTVVNQDLIDGTDLIYDGTLRDEKWAVQNIREASKQGWLINVVSVTRPIKLVAVGVVERAIGEGRAFALADLPDAHHSAQRSAINIAKHFEGDLGVKVDFYYNGGSTRDIPTDHITLEEVDIGGKYSYDTQNGKDRERTGEMVGGPPEGDSQSNDDRFRSSAREEIVGVFRDAVAGKITFNGKRASREVLAGLAGKDVELQRILRESGSGEAKAAGEAEDLNQTVRDSQPSANASLLAEPTGSVLPQLRHGERGGEFNMDSSRETTFKAEGNVDDSGPVPASPAQGKSRALEIAEDDFEKRLSKHGERHAESTRGKKGGGNDPADLLGELEKKYGKEKLDIIVADATARREAHAPYKPEFDAAIVEIARGHQAEPLLAELKGIPRSTEKILTPGKGGENRLKDIIRASIVARSAADLPAITASVEKAFGGRVQIKDRFSKPLPSGYRDMMITVDLAPGIHAEVQIHVPEMIRAKEVAHAYYEEQRSLSRKDPRHKELDDVMKDIYEKAYQLSVLRGAESTSE